MADRARRSPAPVAWLSLARLRARGQPAELRERDLRFTSEEATELLREAMGLELPADSAAALVARAEGWVAGLQLAGLSLRGHRDPAGFVATFSGSHRYVLDYLADEVLARQPEPLVEFLLTTSVLERLSGPLRANELGLLRSGDLRRRRVTELPHNIAWPGVRTKFASSRSAVACHCERPFRN